jgi:nucleotide-binding universal stress UspA family protein
VLYREILVAVDGSRESQRALVHAAALARDEHARLTLVTVIAPVAVSPVPTLSSISCVRDSYAEILARARDSVPDDVGVTTMLIDGSPAREIVRLAKTGRFDLIVMGTHGRGRLAGALLGSVSREVLHCAGMPVLLLPYAARSSNASLIPSASEPSSSRSARTSPARRC